GHLGWLLEGQQEHARCGEEARLARVRGGRARILRQGRVLRASVTRNSEAGGAVVSGPKHTPLVHLGVELDYEEAQDVIDTLQDLVNSQERDIERLAEALKQLLDYTLACELIVYD